MSAKGLVGTTSKVHIVVQGSTEHQSLAMVFIPGESGNPTGRPPGIVVGKKRAPKLQIAHAEQVAIHGRGGLTGEDQTARLFPADSRTIQAYLGHRNIQHTVRYTELNGRRFKGLWD
jgi:hypothetical protein